MFRGFVGQLQVLLLEELLVSTLYFFLFMLSRISFLFFVRHLNHFAELTD